jgi:hypothetical protein
MLARTYALVGNEKEARAEGAEVLRIDPNFRMDRFFKGLFLLNQVQKDRMARPTTHSRAEVRRP